MKLSKRLVVSVVLSLMLVAAFASAASAAPKSIRPYSVCSSVATIASDSPRTSGDGWFRVQAFLQQLKNSDGSSCGDFRVKLLTWSTSGSIIITLRGGDIYDYNTGHELAGSSFTDGTDYWQGTTASASYGPWTGSCGHGLSGSVFAFDNNNGYASSVTNLVTPC